MADVVHKLIRQHRKLSRERLGGRRDTLRRLSIGQGQAIKTRELRLGVSAAVMHNTAV